MNQRKVFLNYFFSKMKSYDYALLKFMHETIDDIPEGSDIDMVISRVDLRKILNIVRHGENIERIQFHKKSFVTFACILFEDGSYLELDLLHRFDRKGIIYLDALMVLDDVDLLESGLKVASHAYSFDYILLFYLLNDAVVPQKYREYFASFNTEERAGIFVHMTSKYGVNINVLEDLYSLHSRHVKKIRIRIDQLPVNSGIRRISNRLRYFTDVIMDSIHHRGITITFSGVDGAGKSTIIDEVNEVLKSKFRQRTVILRHRPSILPILSSWSHGKENAEQRTRERLPRQGTNNSRLSSFFRFMYYYTDYVFGQFYIYFKYTLRGYTILYDRYYFDFIIDSKRSNIVLPKWLMKFGYHLIFKPELNVFLYADPEVIRGRKRELDAASISELTSDYKQLFSELSSNGKKRNFLVLNNVSKEETFHRVMKECIYITI
jgi:thymidylate kinase